MAEVKEAAAVAALNPAQAAIDEGVYEATKAAFLTLVSNLSGGMQYHDASARFNNQMRIIRQARQAVGEIA